MSSEEIATFMQITGVEDESVASQYLEMSGSNLDTAVSLYFENGTSLAPPATDIPPPATGEVRPAIQSSVQRLVDDIPYYNPTASISPPARIFTGGAPSGIFNQTSGFDTHEDDEETGIYASRFRNHSRMNIDEDDDDEDYVHPDEDDGNNYSDEELVQELDSDGDITYTRRRVVRRRNRGPPLRQQTAHQRRLAQLFSPPWDIISKYDLNMAKTVGRQMKKWIIVNVQDNSDFRCQQLNRDLWSDSEVKDIIKENFIFLQYQKDSPVGQEYIAYYPFTEYPHILILDPKTGERVKMWSEVVEPKKFIEQVVDFLTRFSLEPGKINPIVHHKTKIDPSSLSEEQQMELLIRQSLGHKDDDDEGVIEKGDNDRNPIVLDSEDDDQEFSEFEEISDDEIDKENAVVPPAIVEQESFKDSPSTLDEPKEENLDELTDEEVFAIILPAPHPEPENEPATTTRIQIRSGDGSRVVRRFNKLDPVQFIYEYIKNDFESVKGGKFFNLTSQRTNLIRSIRSTIEEAGLLNSSLLLEIEDSD